MKQSLFFTLIISLCLFSSLKADENDACENNNKNWVWVYTKEFSANEQHAHGGAQEMLVEKKKLSPFTQLILSWNAYRPTRGQYTFWVQGRDAQTGLWSSWHKMMSWGPSLQCSYQSDADMIAQHHHVRFEACQGKKMQGFRVKVTAHGGASLQTLHALTVTYADLTNFTEEDSACYDTLPSVRIKKVPKRSQFALQHPEKHRLCSPTSCAILIEYFSQERCNMHTLAHAVFDKGLDTYGSWPFNMAHAFELCQGSHWWRVVRLPSFKQLHAMLQHGCPVAVSVRGFMRGAPKSYDNGHLLVFIGYDASTKAVICHDPACAYDKITARKYALEDFLRAWEKSHRLAYCAYERKNETQ
jgi:hypothetical protein